LEEVRASFLLQGKEKGIDERALQGALARLGSRVEYLHHFPGNERVLPGGILESELRYYLEVEQAETVEDLLGRRLGVDLSSGNGLELLSVLGTIFQELKPELPFLESAEQYRIRIQEMRDQLAEGRRTIFPN
jgi:glycerol-3-phosphate dehydrogenase